MFLIVGAGSIGTQYLDYLLEKYPPDQLAAVEPSTASQQKLSSRGIRYFTDLDQALQSSFPVRYGVVSNWGPDHADTALRLMRHGIKKLIIEKPLATNSNQLKVLRETAHECGTLVYVHYRWAYNQLPNIIKELADTYELHEPVSARFLGGALCLSTGGIHWIDLALEVLAGDFESVVSMLQVDRMNPRSESLVYVGGTASFRLKNGKRILLDYDNNSSEGPRSEIVYTHGRISIDISGCIHIFKRDQASIDRWGSKLTRYGTHEKLATQNFANSNTVPKVLENMLDDSTPLVGLSRALKSTTMLLAALQSNQNGMQVTHDMALDVDLPIS